MTNTPSSPAQRSPWRALAVWLLGAGPIILVLLETGQSGIRGAITIAVVAAFISWCLGLDFLGRAASVLSLMAITGFGALVTVPVVGRAPLPLAIAGLLVAEEVLSGLRILGRGPRPTVRLFALPLSVAAALTWVSLESIGSTVAVLALATVVAWGGGSVPRVGAHEQALQAAIERRCRRLLGHAGDGVDGTRVSGLVAGRQRVGELAESLAARLGALSRSAGDGGRRVVAWSWASLRSTLRAGKSWLVNRRNRLVVLTGLAAAGIVAPIYPRLVPLPPVLVRGTNDIPGTIHRAEWIRFWPLRMSVPHPGWSLLLRLFMPILGTTGAVVFILSAATGAGAALLVTVARSRWDDLEKLRWPFACSLGLGWVLLENPAVLIPSGDAWWQRFDRAGEIARGTSYSPLHQWSTPTITLSMPFVFALFGMVLMALRKTDAGAPDLQRFRRGLGLLTVVSTLVQPATTLALVPALPVLLILTRRVNRDQIVSALWLIVPGTTVVLGQVWFLASNVSPWEQATWQWRPFWIIPYAGLDRVAFWAVLAFYPVCAWVIGRSYGRDLAVRLAVLGLAISWVPFMLLEQTTVADVPDADLGVSPFMCLILLFVSSLRLLLIELQRLYDRRHDAGFRMPPSAFVATGFLMLMLCAGVVDLAAARGLIPENPG